MKRKRLLIAGFCCLVSLPVQAESIRFFEDIAKVPDGCEELGEVTGKGGGPNWTLFMSDARIKASARKHLLEAAEKAGGNAVALTSERAFLRPEAHELERVEEDGLAYRCEDEE